MKRDEKKLLTICFFLLLLLPIMSMPIIAIGKSVIFDMPHSAVLGDELSIEGIASVGNTVDIAIGSAIGIDGVVIPELNDVELDEFGAFNVDIDTVATYSPGTLKRPGPVKIEAFINRARGVGTIGPDEDNDGSTLILMVHGHLTMELSTFSVNRSDSVVISGDAPGSRQLEILTISPYGGEVGRYGIRETASTGITCDKVSVSDIDHTYSKEIHVSDTAYTGLYTVIVLSYGADGVYGDTDKSNIIEAMNQKYNNPTLGGMLLDQILAVIHGASIDSPKSDDLFYDRRLAVEAPKSYAVRLDDPIVPVAVGEPLTVTGTSDKKEGSEIIITVEVERPRETVKGPRVIRLMPKIVYVENGKFRATFDTSYSGRFSAIGKYTVLAYDGEGNIDEATVYIDTTPSPRLTITPTESTPTPATPIIAIEKSVIFDMPRSVVIGDELSIKGIASVGNTVDIAIGGAIGIDGVVIPELNDVELDEFGAFNVDIDAVATYSPGSLKRPRPVKIEAFIPQSGGGTGPGPAQIMGLAKIEAFINRERGVGTIGPDEDNDGSTLIRPMQGYLTVKLSTYRVNRSDSVVISGYASGSRELEILIISPYGGEVGRYGIRETASTNYTAITYDKVSVSDIDHTYSKEIHVSDTAYTGSYTVIVLSYGADGVYGDTDKSNIIEAMNQKYNNPNLGGMSQDQILDVIHGASIDSPKSDDLFYVQRLAVEAPKSYAVRLDDPIVPVAVGELLTVTGTSDKKEGSEVIITVERPSEITVKGRPRGRHLMPKTVYVKNGKFRATFDTSCSDRFSATGEYTVVAYGGEGNTDEATVPVCGIPIPTPSPGVTITPTETPIIAIEKSVIFDMLRSVAIGDELSIEGIASVGNTVDIAIGAIAIDGVVIPELNDVELDEFGAFNVDIDTVASYTPSTLKRPGPVKIEAFINRAREVGTIGPDEDNDGSTLILMVHGHLTAELSTFTVNRSDSVVISGDAPGSRQLEILIISPYGGEVGRYGLRETTSTNYTGITYDNVSVSDIDHTYSKEIHVSDTAYTGPYTVIVLSYGADGVYGDTDKSNIIEAMNQKYNNPNLGSMSRNQILAVIHGASVDLPKSDDLFNLQRLAVEAPKSYAVRLDDPIVPVTLGEPLTVTGTSDKKEGSEVIITVEGPRGRHLMPKMDYVENGKFRATFDTSYSDRFSATGEYTVVAYDGEGNTDEATVFIYCKLDPTPSPRVTITPTESTPTPATPSFETIFAIAGLLAGAYLLRRRK